MYKKKESNQPKKSLINYWVFFVPPYVPSMPITDKADGLGLKPFTNEKFGTGLASQCSKISKF